VRDLWKHNPRPVEESNTVKILWDFTVVTDRSIHANYPDLIALLRYKTCFLVDFSCPFDYNVAGKEAEKVDKYQDSLNEIQELWHVKADVIPIVIGAPGALSPRFEDWLQRLNITLKSCVLQKSVLLQTAGILRRTLNIHL